MLLSEANDKMAAVQECYLSVCKEKDTLEESIRSKEKEVYTRNVLKSFRLYFVLAPTVTCRISPKIFLWIEAVCV